MNRVIVFVLCILFVSPALSADDPRVGNPRGFEVDILLETFAYSSDDIDADIDLVFQGCPRRDCIPSIDQPEFLPVEEVDFLDPDDLILVVSHDGITRAYPTRILDRHEIVNDWFGETPVAVTFCPLCGSGLAFIRELDGTDVELGVSGLLHNNDLIMYDRKTQSLWQQITGAAIAGPKRGEALQSIPATMSLWGDWKQSHPEAGVLAYADDPSGYTKAQYGDYAENDRLLFPVSKQDARLHVKKVIYGIEIGERSIAVEADWLTEQREWEHQIDGQHLRLEMDSVGAVTATMGQQPVAVHRMFWFAWYSFHPDTSLIQ